MVHNFDADYWNERWKKKETGWDIGYASPAITHYFDQIKNKDVAILIPGCGNAYEAESLLEKGFTNITLIDFAPQAVETLKERFQAEPNIKILCEDFFLHYGQYDFIIEQTFFCALPVNERKHYVQHCAHLLKTNGKLVGLLFNRDFTSPHPPFGGNKEEYKQLFQSTFDILTLETCYNSIPPRKDTELFIRFRKK